jgi:hypothetical protein
MHMMRPNESNEKNLETPGYDLIGDVHGDTDRLGRLLGILGYRPTAGAMSHPEGRRAIFVGDLVDRGPKVAETLRMVRAMVEAGTAHMVLGNHEFNLLSLHLPNGNGGFLRPRTARNLNGVRASLAAFAGRYAELREYLEWFRTLPLYLDLGSLRVVHAEWNAELVAGVNGRTYLDDAFLREASIKGSGAHRTIEILLKGSEVALPAGSTYTDFDGNVRHEVRICWPRPVKGRTFKQVAFGSCDTIPDVQVPAEIANDIKGYGADEPPVFFGHYALNDLTNALVAPNAACLDHGCGKGGMLAAYRWNGERTLSALNFVTT